MKQKLIKLAAIFASIGMIANAAVVPTTIFAKNMSWDFSTQPEEKEENNPILSGAAQWDEESGKIKFNGAGNLNVKMQPNLNGMVHISFDWYVPKNLSGQVFLFNVMDSAGNKVVDFSLNRYDGSGSLIIGGEQAADGAALKNCTDAATADNVIGPENHVDIMIDYTSGTAEITLTNSQGTQNVFTGIIPEEYPQALSEFNAAVTRVKSGNRYVYMDNLSIDGDEKSVNYTADISSTIGVGDSAKLNLISALDKDGNDITDKAVLSDFSSDSTAADIDENGVVTGISNGTANISFKVSVPELNFEETASKKIRVGKYSMISTDNEIDISSLEGYGTEYYRVYKSKTEFETVRAENGIITNPYDSEVTVVPDYKFEFTNGTLDGYIDVSDEELYSSSNGYGLKAKGEGLSENGYKMLKNSDLPFMIDLPDGYYDVRFTKKASGRVDLYCNDNRFVFMGSPGTQNRATAPIDLMTEQIKVEGGIAKFTTSSSLNSQEIETLEIIPVPSQYRKTHIFLCGDSVVANYFPQNIDGDDLESNKNMQTGWGMQIRKYLPDEYSVTDMAIQGQTAQNGYDGPYKSLAAMSEPGDTVIISYGINDGAKSVGLDNADECITNMVNEAKAIGLNPILVSPVYNHKYKNKTYYSYNASSGKNYESELAERLGVPFIDLNKYTREYLNADSGNEDDVNWILNNYHIMDKLHLSQYSALMCASFVAAGLDELGYKTTDYSFIYKDVSETVTDGEHDGYLRGEENGTAREYSVAAAKEIMGIDTNSSISYDGEKAVVKSKAENGILAKASYDGGRLEDIKIYELRFENGMAEQAMELKDGDRLYVWNSVSEMSPIADSYVYSKELQPTYTPTVPTSEPTKSPLQTAEPTNTPTTPTSEPTEPPMQTAEPTNPPVLKLDFEDGSISGWKQSNAGVASIKEDDTPGIGKYFNEAANGSGSRAVEYKLSEALSDSFVFEADIKTQSTNEYAANLSLLASSTTVNSTGANKMPMDGYLLKADMLKNEKKFIFNSSETSNGTLLSGVTGKKILSDETADNEWMHIRTVCNLENKTTKIQLTSLDGSKVYFDGMTDMYYEDGKPIENLRKIYLIAPRANGNFGIDNIVVRKANGSEIEETEKFNKITVVCGNVNNTYYNSVNSSLDSRYIPDVSTYGGYFKGWLVDGKQLSTDELKTYKLTSDTEIRADIDSSYIEKAVSVTFDKFPANNRLIMSDDANGTDFKENEISLKITGENGTDLALNSDDKAKPQIDWDFCGFHTMHGQPTTDDTAAAFPGTKKFCDSYAYVNVNSAYEPQVSFNLRNTSENYYGKVKATVHYGEDVFTVEKPLIIQGNTNAEPGVLFPSAGYVSDFNMFENGMEGDYTSDRTLLGGWSVTGSNSTNRIGIGSDEIGKYLKISKNEKKDSSYFSINLDTSDNQIIFEQNIRFKTKSASVYYKGEAANSFSKNQSAFTVSYTGGKMSINGSEFADNINENEWYRLVICSAVSSQKCMAMLYSADGALIGSSKEMAFQNENVNTPYVYAFKLNDKNNADSEVDINALSIKKQQPASLSIESDAAEISIPDDDSKAEAVLKLKGITEEGYSILSKAKWYTEEEGVSIEEDTDSNSAILKVSKDAPSGVITVKAIVDGVSGEININLKGTKNSVAFTKREKSVLIPNENFVNTEFAAEVRDGNGNTAEGYAVKYSLGNAPSGVSIDSNTGVLTVSSDAKPGTAEIIASAGDISRKISTIIYNYDFSFGVERDNSTYVDASAVYDEEVGFGLEGKTENGNGYISGNDMVFKAKVTPGKVYRVTIAYEGTLYLEKYNRYLTGIKKDTFSELTEKSYEIAVVGDGETVGKGVLDINLSGDGKLASVKIEQLEDKAAGSKPQWIEIGDSTVAQNPSWGYVLAGTWQNYPKLTEKIDNFQNKGRGARQLTSFYNEGLLDNVLKLIRPGDVVSISGMGTNGYSGTIEDFKAQLNYYIDSIEEMGGKVILGSYTPNGNWSSFRGKVYNSDTETFSGKRYADYDMALYEVHKERKDDENILGYIDIGGISDELMTAEVKKARDLTEGTEEEKKAAAQAKAEEMMKWWPNDFNHYTGEFSSLLLPRLTEEIAKLIK